MGFCEIKDPPEFKTQVEKWDRDTMADGEKMGVVIEEIFNNTVHNYKAMRKKATVTLLASGWTGTGPYVQSIPVEGMTEDEEPILIKKIGKDATPEMVKAYNKAFACIDDGDTENGQATFKCYNKKPDIDITVKLKGV